jgi:hypothetical protein
MDAIVLAIIIVAIVALWLVVNARLNRRSPELEAYPRRPDGQTTSGGRAEGSEARGSPRQARPVWRQCPDPLGKAIIMGRRTDAR